MVHACKIEKLFDFQSLPKCKSKYTIMVHKSYNIILEKKKIKMKIEIIFICLPSRLIKMISYIVVIENIYIYYTITFAYCRVEIIEEKFYRYGFFEVFFYLNMIYQNGI